MEEAIIISVITLVSAAIFSAIQMWYTRQQSKHNKQSIEQQIEHNKNSIRPFCEIITNDYIHKISVKIVNFGTGPLIIKKCMCKNAETGAEKPILRELMPRINRRWTDSTSYVIGRTIPVNGEIVLIALEPLYNKKLIDKDTRKLVRNTLSKITIEVDYTDVYERETFKQSRALPFGRKSLQKKCTATTQ